DTVTPRGTVTGTTTVVLEVDGGSETVTTSWRRTYPIASASAVRSSTTNASRATGAPSRDRTIGSVGSVHELSTGNPRPAARLGLRVRPGQRGGAAQRRRPHPRGKAARRRRHRLRGHRPPAARERPPRGPR